MSKLIAVVGMAGSGKSIATDYLEKKYDAVIMIMILLNIMH